MHSEFSVPKSIPLSSLNDGWDVISCVFLHFITTRCNQVQFDSSFLVNRVCFGREAEGNSV